MSFYLLKHYFLESVCVQNFGPLPSYLMLSRPFLSYFAQPAGDAQCSPHRFVLTSCCVTAVTILHGYHPFLDYRSKQRSILHSNPYFVADFPNVNWEKMMLYTFYSQWAIVVCFTFRYRIINRASGCCILLSSKHYCYIISLNFEVQRSISTKQTMLYDFMTVTSTLKQAITWTLVQKLGGSSLYVFCILQFVLYDPYSMNNFCDDCKQQTHQFRARVDRAKLVDSTEVWIYLHSIRIVAYIIRINVFADR